MGVRTDIANRLKEGRQLARAKYKAENAGKEGYLRAGNSGLMSADHQVAGSCHRVAHLRQLDIEIDPPEDSTLIMFQVGMANEDIVYEDLMHTSAGGEIILREEEIPIRWETSNGTPVTGRPDMVLCAVETNVDEKHGVSHLPVPQIMLELKSVASVWTTRSVLIDQEPKLAHLTQAAHYMWKLGSISGRLIYKQYGIQHLPDFAIRFFPREGERGSEFVEYRDGKAVNVRPFELVYELAFNKQGLLRYRIEAFGSKKASKWVDTIVSTADIERFYEFVSRMGENKDLGPRPITVGPDGTDKSFSNCKYCPLNTICNGKDRKKQTYDQWLTSVVEFVTNR